ncbi:MAG: TlpA disulfide reductase family protein [Owenweeksia sp.]|nr:TlpA disulfide reductase family protein [Owenweeksia sp.]
MRKLKSIVALAASALFITACNTQSGPASVSGTVSGTEEMTLVEVQGKKLDTLKVLSVGGENASFNTKVPADSLRVLFLYVNERFNIPLLVNPGEQVELDIDATTPQGNYTVSGSKESVRVKKIMNVTSNAVNQVDSLSKMLQSVQEDTARFQSMKANLDQSYEQIMSDAGNELKAIIDEKPGSMANIYIFTQSVGRRPVLDAGENFSYLEKVAEALKETYPGHSISENFSQDVERYREQMKKEQDMKDVQSNVSSGAAAPEIALPNPDGEIMKLSDLEGQIVLVDFWAAWCKPCRMENPNLVRIYKQYKDQGFTVFSVSLDGLPKQQNPKQQWQQAIEQDKAHLGHTCK